MINLRILKKIKNPTPPIQEAILIHEIKIQMQSLINMVTADQLFCTHPANKILYMEEENEHYFICSECGKDLTQEYGNLLEGSAEAGDSFPA